MHFGRAGIAVAGDVLITLGKLRRVARRIALIDARDAFASDAPELSKGINYEVNNLANKVASSVDDDHVSILTPFVSIKAGDRKSFYGDAIHPNDRGYEVLCVELGRWLTDNG
jgi:hypothetical protein